MSNNKLKIGITATGRIAKSFIKAVEQNDNLEVVAINSRTEESAKKFSEKYEISNYYSDINELVQSNIDIVYVNSPNSFHYEQAKLALENKKHVLIEKTATLNNEQLVELFEIAKKNRVILLEGIVTIHMPIMEKLKEDLQNFGEVLKVNFHLTTFFEDKFADGSLLPKFQESLGGGAMYGLGPYVMYPSLYLFSKPNEFKIKKNISSQYGVDISTNIDLIYENFDINCFISLRNINKNSQVIMLSEATIYIDDITSFNTYEVYDSQGNFLKKEINDSKHRMEYELKYLVSQINKKDESYEEFKKYAIDVNQILTHK